MLNDFIIRVYLNYFVIIIYLNEYIYLLMLINDYIYLNEYTYIFIHISYILCHSDNYLKCGAKANATSQRRERM